MAKKVFYFSLSLFVLVLIFLGAYNFAFKNNPNNPIADPLKNTIENIGDTPLFGEESISNPINEAVIGAVAGEDGLLYYYSLDDQSLKKATLEGKNKTILMSNLPGTVTRVLWSTKKDKVLLFLKQSSGGMLWYFASLSNKSLVPLKPEMSRLAWDNFGEKIYYQYTDAATNKRSLNIANPDGSAWKKLADLGTAEFFLASAPQSSLVSFWKRPLAEANSALETVSAVGENRQTLFAGLYGGDYSWSPSGERVLMSGHDKGNNSGISLRVLATSDKATRTLSIPTLISKTTWSKDERTLYYALPGALPEGALLPDDYFGKPLFTKDTFWKVDVVTGKKDRLIDLKESTQSLDSTDLFLSQNEEFLFFTDRVSKRLYRIEL